MSQLYSRINNHCRYLEQEVASISQERKTYLVPLINYLSQQYKQGIRPKVIIICTHDSRRSHIGQLWLAKSADYYDLPIKTYSGGTEATAFYPSAVAALKRAGFAIGLRKEQANPTYLVKWKTDMIPYEAFSKKYNDAPNPNENFIAILVCTQADEGCPLITGANFRFSLPFDDPKRFDGTDVAEDEYDKCCQQIGREFFYLMEQVKAITFNER